MLDVRFIHENASLIKKDVQKRGESEKIGVIDEIICKSEEFKKLKEEN